MLSKTVQKNLKLKSELFSKDIYKIAEQVRIEIIKPFCDKYNLDWKEIQIGPITFLKYRGRQ